MEVFLKQLKKILFLSSSVLLAGFLSSCGGKTETDSVAEAQDCLNKSTEANSLACMSFVEGKTSAGANLIRCAAYFKDQGFSEPSRISDITQNMTVGGGDNAVTAAMSFLAFKSSKYSNSENLTLIRAASAYCAASGSKGMVVLSTISSIATETLGLANLLGSNPTPEAVATALCGPSAPLTTIGTATLTAYNSGCIGTNGASSNPFCDAVKLSVGSNSDATVIGSELQTRLCN